MHHVPEKSLYYEAVSNEAKWMLRFFVLHSKKIPKSAPDFGIFVFSRNDQIKPKLMVLRKKKYASKMGRKIEKLS